MKVSVVMASFNPLRDNLEAAVKSILRQTYKDFNLIIVDDGSIEPIESIVRSISSDVRIEVYRISHSGLGAALNFGIARSSAQYIARLDDDDLMMPERLRKQVDYLDLHADCSCLGTQHYDRVGNKYKKHRRYPVLNDIMVQSMLSLRFPMAHTSLMFRHNVFDKIGGYRVAGGGQDVDLILQLSTVGRLANLNEYLTIYSMSSTGLGTVNRNKYHAYLFAFDQIVQQNVYPEYCELIESSINRLKRREAGNRRVMLYTKIIRKILVLKVILFGKKLQVNESVK